MTERPSYARGPDSQRSLAGSAGSVAVYGDAADRSGQTRCRRQGGSKSAGRQRRRGDRERSGCRGLDGDDGESDRAVGPAVLDVGLSGKSADLQAAGGCALRQRLGRTSPSPASSRRCQPARPGPPRSSRRTRVTRAPRGAPLNVGWFRLFQRHLARGKRADESEPRGRLSNRAAERPVLRNGCCRRNSAAKDGDHAEVCPRGDKGRARRTRVVSCRHNHTARQVIASTRTMAAAGAPRASRRRLAIVFCGTKRSGDPNRA